MSHMPDQVIFPRFMEIRYQLCDTGVDQFHAAELSDVGLNHEGIHAADPFVDPHHPCGSFCQTCDAVMIKINAMKPLIIVTAHPEAGQALVTEGLLLKAGRMQRHLIPGIQHEIVNNLII
jgi:hypothetical protein